MKLCECGCGKEVTNVGNRFIKGHFWVGKKLSEETKENISKTIKSKEVQEKIKQSNLEKYGYENPMQSEKVKTNFRESNIKKYGKANPMQSEEVKEKFKHTCEEKFGGPAPLCSEIIQEKTRQTCKKNYGFENPMQSEEVKEKFKHTCEEKFGGSSPICSKEIRKKGQKTCFKNHGVDNYSKTFEFRQFAREQMIAAVTAGLRDDQTFSPMKGRNEKLFVADLQLYLPYFIDNDATIIGYFPDGYITELNLVIEFDEPYHTRICFKERDAQKDEDYQKIGLKVFRVKEKDWLTNKDQVISQFQSLITQLSEQIKNFDKELIV